MLGCSSLDSLFTESRRFFDDEVIIIGAGLAGLTAAYELKKNKVPYRVFEASDRIGGRVFSVQGFGGSDLWGELGGEFVYGNQSHILDLAKELGYKPSLLKEKAEGDDLFVLNGKTFSSQRLKKQVPAFAKKLYDVQLEAYQGQDFLINYENAARFPNLMGLDNKSSEDVLKDFAKDSDEELLAIVRLLMENRFGVKASEMSGLQFITEARFRTSGTYVLSGGWSQVTQTLYDRVSGGVPRFLVRGQHQLTEINKSPLGYELTFKSADGKRSFFAKKVILALPFGAYRHIQGWESFGFSDAKMESLVAGKMGRAEKGLFSAENLNLSSSQFALGDFASNAIWQTSRAGVVSVNAYQRMATTDVAKPRIEADLLKISSKNSGVLKEVGPSIKWAERRFSHGNLPYFAPGEFTKLNGLLARPEENGQLQFAGDYAYLHEFATMDAAVRSGKTAARAFIKGT